ncbi:Fur family transcriptional regulator [Candidatus Arthromitus sp. SFB-turkey]|uniref:Fur family transcriptional regulator n=1 Tax=Candidatus Arthromitus sp. SFB-turkey TaxID=1840217 RepID=UPI0007F3DB7F|nr:Fur family transcriptional regulator [Candidatus Arthromitus sp. SFB-turkey]OAT86849.1 transcriptional repressor [Candidatus Arthromitus sp. SFB-turkey]HJD00255.1 transcriptional repressor [Candidatus Dwaynia gallinarum]
MQKKLRDIEEIKLYLKSKGYKLTAQRECILGIIIENKDKHLTVDEIYKYVYEKNRTIGIATVYRTILLFEELGVISKLIFDDRIIRYELSSLDEEHTHHHLICVKCNKIMEVKEDLLEELEKQVEDKYEFKILDHNLKILGICNKCNNQ